MAGRFHINQMGEVGPCMADPGKCPFGRDNIHYDSAQEARHAYEEAMTSKTFTLSLRKKKKEKLLPMDPSIDWSKMDSRSEKERFENTPEYRRDHRLTLRLAEELERENTILDQEYGPAPRSLPKL